MRNANSWGSGCNDQLGGGALVTTPEDAMQRDQFLNLAGAFQGGLVLLAVLLGWLFDVNPWQYVAWDARSWLWAGLATLPLCSLSLLLDWSEWKLARDLRELWLSTLGPAVAQCRWWDLVLLSLLVGVSEELLFRGVVQMALARWSVVGAVLLTNALFALVHAVTPAYAVLAGLVGLYLSLVMILVEPPNLLIPVVAHAGCDLFSFWCIRRRQQRLL